MQQQERFTYHARSLSHLIPKLYGRLVEELEHNHTKGNNNYPTNMLKAYQLINEYKSWTPRTSLPEVSGVAFSHKGTSKQRKELWSGKIKQSATTAARKDTLNITSQNRSSTTMTQMRKTTRLPKTSQERKRT